MQVLLVLAPNLLLAHMTYHLHVLNICLVLRNANTGVQQLALRGY